MKTIYWNENWLNMTPCLFWEYQNGKLVLTNNKKGSHFHSLYKYLKK